MWSATTIMGIIVQPQQLRLLLMGILLLGGMWSPPTVAQLGGLVPDRPSVEEPQRLEKLPQEQPAPVPGLRMPALPPPPSPPSDKRLSSQLKVAVNRIELTGNTVFSDEQLAEVIAPYRGRALSSEDLQSLRHALRIITSITDLSTRVPLFRIKRLITACCRSTSSRES